MHRQTALFVLLLASTAAAQRPSPATTPPNAEAGTLLKHLADQTVEYRKSLPSFTCEEDVVSTVKIEGKISKRVDYHATIRVMRQLNGELQETFNVTRYNGRAAKANRNVDIPITVEGGLSKGLPGFFSAGTQACYRYTVTPSTGTPTRIAFQESSRAPSCEIVRSAYGFAELDTAGNITHGETHQAPEYAASHELTTYGLIDYASVPLNGRDYRLPTHLYAEMQDHDWLGTFEAHYSSCKLFHATITLGPATLVPKEDQP